MAVDKDTTMAEAGKDSEKDKKQEASKKSKKKGEAEKPELSDEDLELKANLEMMVERISDGNTEIQNTALDNISRYAVLLGNVFSRQDAAQTGQVRCLERADNDHITNLPEVGSKYMLQQAMSKHSGFDANACIISLFCKRQI